MGNFKVIQNPGFLTDPSPPKKKIESPVAVAIPDLLRKFQKDRSRIFCVMLLTVKETNKQTNSGKNITSLEEVITEKNMLTAGFKNLQFYKHCTIGKKNK